MYKTITVLILFCLLASAAPISATTPAPLDMLRAVDAFRNPFDGFEVDITLKSFAKERETDTWNLKVSGRDGDKSLVEFVAPAIEKGKFLLMLSDAMWIYLPNTSKPLRISPQQRLMGEAANGDVARNNYATDYDASLAGEDSVEGQKAYILDLTAKDGQISYSRIRLWVRSSDYRPIQAEYSGTSGKLLKRAFFRTFSNVNGKPVVEQIDIHDAVRTDRRTLMIFSNLRAKNVPEKLFNQSYLGRW
jgi:outer membrane lipoprotein-sorting protein